MTTELKNLIIQTPFLAAQLLKIDNQKFQSFVVANKNRKLPYHPEIENEARELLIECNKLLGLKGRHSVKILKAIEAIILMPKKSIITA